MQFGQRVIQRMSPLGDVAAQQVLHDGIGVVLDRAEWESPNPPHELLELAGEAGVTRPMARIVRTRSDLVDEHSTALRYEHLDRENPDQIELFCDVTRESLGPPSG